MVDISGPVRLTFGSRDAYVWTVVLDGVPHRLAWMPGTGTLRLSWLADEKTWVPFVQLGPDYSPRPSLASARHAVETWAARQAERNPGRHQHRAAS